MSALRSRGHLGHRLTEIAVVVNHLIDGESPAQKLVAVLAGDAADVDPMDIGRSVAACSALSVSMSWLRNVGSVLEPAHG